jgi:small conductance mechanosensitive channel
MIARAVATGAWKQIVTFVAKARFIVKSCGNDDARMNLGRSDGTRAAGTLSSRLPWRPHVPFAGAPPSNDPGRTAMENYIHIAGQWWREFGPVMNAGIRILLVLCIAWIVSKVVKRAIRAFRVRVASHLDDREAAKRAETLGRVFRYIAMVVIWLIAVLVILSEVGVSVAPILGAAGVAGLAIGFGAQSLVKDYFTGFFLLLENQIRQGDVVKLGDHAGLVEDVTLRFVQLRDYDGNVHFVPNGTIVTVVNMSRGHAQAVVDVGVAYKEDIDRVTGLMREVGATMRGDKDFGPRILDDFELAGVEKLDDSAVVIRGRFRVLPLEQWNVKREYLRRVKYAFDRNGIEIPFPHLTLYPGFARAGRPAVFPVEFEDPRAGDSSEGTRAPAGLAR